MGGGRKPKSTRSTVNKQSDTLVSAAAHAGGGATTTELGKRCIINFKAKLLLAGAKDVEVNLGDEVFLSPSDTSNKLEIGVKSRSYGLYTGPNASIMWRCANEGFIYMGTVGAIHVVDQGLEVDCEIRTMVRD